MTNSVISRKKYQSDPELFSEPLPLAVPVGLHARFLSCHILPYTLKTCTWSQMPQCVPTHILPVPYRKKNITHLLLTVPFFYCSSKPWHIQNLSTPKEILKKCFSSFKTLFGSPVFLITVMPFWYAHSSWEQLGKNWGLCLIVSLTVSKHLWVCKLKVLWEYLCGLAKRGKTHGNAVFRELNLWAGPSAFSSVILRIVLRVSNSCIHPFLPAKRDSTCLPLCSSWSNPFSAQLSAHTLPVIEGFLVSPQLVVLLLYPSHHPLCWNTSHLSLSASPHQWQWKAAMQRQIMNAHSLAFQTNWITITKPKLKLNKLLQNNCPKRCTHFLPLSSLLVFTSFATLFKEVIRIPTSGLWTSHSTKMSRSSTEFLGFLAPRVSKWWIWVSNICQSQVFIWWSFSKDLKSR